MSDGPRYHVKFRRRRENRTDYRKRLALLKSGLPRAVVRKTLKNTIVQIALYHESGDRIVASAVSSELKKFGWEFSTKSVPAAYLTGYLAGLRAKKAEIEKAVLDSGLLKPTKGGRIYAAMKGLVDAGIDIPHGDETEPDEERLKGKHLNENIEKIIDQIKEKMVI
ncbi:MAG: 50S ribosomal protein L18 [Thermoplasmata archaeon]|nr:50S ribosomal protein L18 [Euryarchaeota archaeon]MVT35678.1 50S ribosomal protein L18 [Euryarchaeota archaeon]